MTQNTGLRRREILCANRRHCAGAHIGDGRAIDNGTRYAGTGIHEIDGGELRRISALIVIDEVADNFYTGDTNGRDIASQHIEVTVEAGIRHEVHTRLDDRVTFTLRMKTSFMRIEYLVIGHLLCRHVVRREIPKVDVMHVCKPEHCCCRTPSL